MNDTTPTWRTDQLQDRVDRLEQRLTDHQVRIDKRIFDVYATIYWVLFIMLIGAEICMIIAAAAKH